MSYINPNITNIISNGVQNLQAQMQAQQMQMQAQQMRAKQEEPVYPDDPDYWDDDEQLKMFIWFMKMHHEEDIKGFKALRDIERSVERAEQEEKMRKYWEAQHQAMQNGNLYTTGWTDPTLSTTTTTGTWGATNAVNTISPHGRVSAAQDEPKESLWKRLWYKI